MNEGSSIEINAVHCAVSSIAVVEAEVEKCLLKMFETVDLVKSVEEDGLQY